MAMLNALYIGLGGFLGANARYFLAAWLTSKWGVGFPYGTLCVNVSGSFVLCLLIAAMPSRLVADEAQRLVIAVGFLGSYTTFSTFSYEWLHLLLDGQIARCMLYGFGSVIGGGLAGALGLLLGRML